MRLLLKNSLFYFILFRKRFIFEKSLVNEQITHQSGMKSILYIALLFIIFGVATGCGISPKRAAKDYCNCLQPLADIHVLMDTLKTQGLIDSLAAVTIVYEEVWNDSQECMDKKLDEYGQKGASSAFKQKTRKLIKSKCPEVWERTPKH
jgi:hypothetical protein